ncbi:MAG: hypothetical protein A2289_25965 [Deltaproteobacteria bacterium RIFOXYA12_FULL_58_15]|nr:MAG: hypothetical protein A2289_25965 [Deltaproteobacteria bacterium RIFOXYA12_FULL_58_15]OGR11646.1 MAG: hypothetical protein A2341_02730 [Deltaproteobacteria bacterium RIFOXYB12_FULL_58_9]
MSTLTLALVSCAALGSGTFAVASDQAARTIVDHGTSVACHALVPSETFVVQGPAKIEIELRVDLTKRPSRPKPVKLTATLDGNKKVHRLRPKRGKDITYEPASLLMPSRPLGRIHVMVEPGEHRLQLELGAKRSGCVVLAGLTLAPKATLDPPAPTTPELPAPTTPEPTSEAQKIELTDIRSSSAMEEIRATTVGETSVSTVHVAVDGPGVTRTDSRDILRLGPKIGGVLPRGDLQAGFFVGLLIDLPLSTLGVPSDLQLASIGLDLSAYVEAGWSPMKQQGEVLIPGRGQTELIQNSQVFPLELGARLRLDVGALLMPYAAVGLAADISQTEIQAFSNPPMQHTDVALGVSFALGAYLPLGPGGVIAEIRYREVGIDLGEFDDVAEPTLAAAALHLGYVFVLE